MNQNQTASPIIQLLHTMKTHDLSQMPQAEVIAFREDVARRFHDAILETFAPILAEIPGEAYRSHMPFVHVPIVLSDRASSISQANLIPSHRFKEFQQAATQEDGVFDVLEQEPVTLAIGLEAQTENNPEPYLYAALTCGDQPAQRHLERAVMDAGAELQSACAGVGSFLVYSQGETDISTCNPPNLAIAMKDCVTKIGQTVAAKRDGYLEPFGLELLITPDTPPPAVGVALTALIQLYRAVTGNPDKPALPPPLYSHVARPRTVH